MADEAKLPTEEEIAQLPRWARVAFAARCARRVLPLLRRYWPGLIEENRRQIRLCVRNAEAAAARGLCDEDIQLFQDLGAVNAAHHFGVAALNNRNQHGASVALCAAFALYAAYAKEATRTKQAAVAVKNLEVLPEREVFFGVRRDYDLLAYQALRDEWTEDTVVSPAIFGLMWPQGTPADWPEDDEPDQQSSLQITLVAKQPVDPAVVGNAIVKLWEVANEYHMARGGGVLTFDEFRLMVPALVPVGPEAGG